MKRIGYVSGVRRGGSIGCEWIFDRIETPDARIPHLGGCKTGAYHGLPRMKPDDIKIMERRVLLGCMEARS
jgi:hypothetical protein